MIDIHTFVLLSTDERLKEIGTLQEEARAINKGRAQKITALEKEARELRHRSIYVTEAEEHVKLLSSIHGAMVKEKVLGR